MGLTSDFVIDLARVLLGTSWGPQPPYKNAAPLLGTGLTVIGSTGSRVRITLGLACVAAGTAWAVGGVHAIGAGASALLATVPALTVVVGVLIILRAAMPRGALAGPLVLIAAGSVALFIQFNAANYTVIYRMIPAMLVAGGVVVAMGRRSGEPDLPSIVLRYWSMLLPVSRRVQSPAPHKLIVYCLLGHLTLDFTQAAYPTVSAPRITVDLTLLGGRVEFLLPDNWTVQAGRLSLAKGTQFSGRIGLFDQAADEPSDDEFGLNLVVLNVQGWSGMVCLVQGHHAEPPSSSADGDSDLSS